MATVFVDTATWIALINVRDALHNEAKDVMRELRRSAATLVTTDFVLSVRAQTIAFIDGLRRLGTLRIVPASHELLMAGWQLYSQRPNKDWSLTDCTSLVVMRQEQITTAFTSDHHFEQAGFAKLLQ